MKTIRHGTVIATRHWWGEHWLIVAQCNGRLTAISNSARRGGVAEEWLGDVLKGQQWRVVENNCSLPAERVIARARNNSGRPYNLLSWNCEHFVRWVHGLPAVSPQRDGVIAALAIVGLGVAVVGVAKAR